MGKLKLKKYKISKLNNYQKSKIKGGNTTENTTRTITVTNGPLKTTKDNNGCLLFSFW